MRALVFSIDDAYVMPFKVLWHSLMKTGSVPNEVPVFILHAETLSADSIQNLTEFLEKYGRTVTFKDARSFVPDDVPLSHHISKATYYRLFVSSILPHEITSAVYLDSDAVVLKSIREIFELKLTGLIAAADHMAPSIAFRLWGGLIGNYFQAGVLLVDIQKWRTNRLEDEFRKILVEKRDQILWWDQDVLNMAFQNQWQRLPIWFNLSGKARAEIPDAIVDECGCYFHLDGSNKPWKYYSGDRLANQWYTLYFETFGEKFDLKKIRRPLWRRLLSISKIKYQLTLNDVGLFNLKIKELFK